jgi:predicted acetyltransferase
VADKLEIRPITQDEFRAAIAVTNAAFGENPTEEDIEAWRPAVPFDRTLAAFENGRMVAITAVLSLDLTVPGGVAVPMGGLTWVATLPTHRRRGLLNRLTTAHFEAMSARGEAVSGLIASEGVIYGRFGYGPATSVMGFRVDRARSAFAKTLEEAPAGRLLMVDSDEAVALLPTIYDHLRLRQPGTVSRTQGIWHAHLSDPPHERGEATRMFHVVHETRPGVPDGYASYRLKGKCTGGIAENDLSVVELVADGPRVHKALWGYLLNTDLTQTVSCSRGRVDEPLRWLLADPRQFHTDMLFDFLWLRLLDVPCALAARRYAAAGELVFEVLDPFPTSSTTRFLLTVEPGGAGSEETAGTSGPVPDLRAECTRTSSAPDLAIEVGTLGAAYLGGVSFTTLSAAGRVREMTPGAVARADAMFSYGSLPFCATEF